MQKYSPEERKRGMECYFPEIEVFPNFSKTKKLTKRDVLLILKWKHGRMRKDSSITISDDNLSKINKTIKQASHPNNKSLALEELKKIHGIGLATATVILSLCYPEEFSIIDRRVLESLDLKPFDTKKWSVSDYLKKFLPEAINCREEWKSNMRYTDRVLWGISVDKQLDKIIEKSA